MDGKLHLDLIAIRTQTPCQSARHLTAMAQFAQGGLKLPLQGHGHQVEIGSSADLLRAVAMQLFGTGVPFENPPFLIQRGNRQRGTRQQHLRLGDAQAWLR